MPSICPLNKKKILFISIALVIVVLNVLAWNSTAFCDVYLMYIFPVWINTYGRITGLFSFSVGEWMIAAGMLLVLFAVLAAPAAVWAFFCRRERLGRFLKGFYTFFVWVLLIVSLVMTLNCFILYHGSSFSEKYFGEDTEDYTLEELLEFRNMVVEQCNYLSGRVCRDFDGKVMYESSVNMDGKPVDMQEEARRAMRKMGEAYERLDGWYPRPKALRSSDFMCQQYMQGYYFPFSLEANYNDVMEVMRKPATMCHELAHVRGYIFEDEANFIAYLACIQSDNIYFQYSGYLSVLNYLENDLYSAAQNNPEVFREAVRRVKPLQVYETVREDNLFVSEEEWERINKKAVLDTTTVSEAADDFLNLTLKANGVADGTISYHRVVRLLLQYARCQEE